MYAHSRAMSQNYYKAQFHWPRPLAQATIDRGEESPSYNVLLLIALHCMRARVVLDHNVAVRKFKRKVTAHSALLAEVDALVLSTTFMSQRKSTE